MIFKKNRKEAFINCTECRDNHLDIEFEDQRTLIGINDDEYISVDQEDAYMLGIQLVKR